MVIRKAKLLTGEIVEYDWGHEKSAGAVMDSPQLQFLGEGVIYSIDGVRWACPTPLYFYAERPLPRPKSKVLPFKPRGK